MAVHNPSWLNKGGRAVMRSIIHGGHLLIKSVQRVWPGETGAWSALREGEIKREGDRDKLRKKEEEEKKER